MGTILVKTPSNVNSAFVFCPRCRRKTLRHRTICPSCCYLLDEVSPRVLRERKEEEAYKQAPQPRRLPTAKPGMAFVYLIFDGTYCKIGYAADLEQRLSNLQNASARHLSVRAIVETSRPRELERILHGLFAKKHVKREWFKSISKDEWLDCLAKAPEYYDLP